MTARARGDAAAPAAGRGPARATAGNGPDQLVLRLAPTVAAGFESYVSGANAEALATLRAMAGTPGLRPVYLCGEAGVGKTHLLLAASREAAPGEGGCAYLPLRRRSELSPALLEGLEACSLVCVDDVDAVAGDRSWEEPLFHLYNQLEARRGRLVLSGRAAPGAAGFRLPDLVSRLAAGAVFRLYPLDDAGRAAALRVHARRRGFDMGGEVLDYLLRRLPRDMHSLIGVLDDLDRGSLRSKRRLTLPFVREVLEREGRLGR